MPDVYPDVQGCCPACRAQSLFLGAGGYVTCARLECPDPEAATKVLERRPDSCGSCGARPVTYYAPDGLPACADCAPCDCGTEPCSKPDVVARRDSALELAQEATSRAEWDVWPMGTLRRPPTPTSAVPVALRGPNWKPRPTT